jgi:hypothetical protein
MNDARKAQAAVIAFLSRPHTLFHEAVLGRAVKRLALRAHCFASAGVPLTLLHEAHLGSAVKRLAVRTHRLAVAGLRYCCTDREAGNQHRYNNTPHFNLLCSQLRRGCWPSVTDTEASVCGIVQYDKRALHPPQTEEFRPQSEGLKTGYCR